MLIVTARHVSTLLHAGLFISSLFVGLTLLELLRVLHGIQPFLSLILMHASSSLLLSALWKLLLLQLLLLQLRVFVEARLRHLGCWGLLIKIPIIWHAVLWWHVGGGVSMRRIHVHCVIERPSVWSRHLHTILHRLSCVNGAAWLCV